MHRQLWGESEGVQAHSSFKSSESTRGDLLCVMNTTRTETTCGCPCDTKTIPQLVGSMSSWDERDLIVIFVCFKSTRILSYLFHPIIISYHFQMSKKSHSSISEASGVAGNCFSILSYQEGKISNVMSWKREANEYCNSMFDSVAQVINLQRLHRLHLPTPSRPEELEKRADPHGFRLTQQRYKDQQIFRG